MFLSTLSYAEMSSKRTDMIFDTPASSNVTPYMVSADSIVPLRCVTTTNCVFSENRLRKRPKFAIFVSSSGASISSNTEKGAITTKQCKVGCVGCSLCVKSCPNNAVKFENFNATIDYTLCKNCGACAEKCPKKVINELYQ